MAREEAVAEEWRAVVGFEGRYEVSSGGRVRSLLTGKVLRVNRHRAGYALLHLMHKEGRRVARTAHSLVAEAFLGPPNGLHVNHRDGNTGHDSLANLEYVTRSQNIRHAVDQLGKMRGRRPDVHIKPKLSEAQVREIRRSLGTASHAAIAARFGVSKAAISHIASGRNWGSVT